ncbi:MAG: SUMF1/EgtB/PvdO family nonheme iron enzyme [Chitinophagaceae bacterium]|nr:SUMF1/EgtB/PvdO family nonheme iron enzyme [Chitinophagaceae bacterium]
MYRSLCLSIFILLSGISYGQNQPAAITNSLGMQFRLIPGGTFRMGEANRVNAGKLGAPAYLEHGDYDEQPVHNVKISNSFYIARDQVTVEDYQKFDPGYKGVEAYYPYATGISWNDAAAYCKWLSEKEGKPYRLPTEAEWEYACRAGTQSVFYTGDNLPGSKVPNPWGVYNMSDKIAEWVYDWYGPYPDARQTDPAGPSGGIAKVIRGAGLDNQQPFYSRSANRAGYAPGFPPVSLNRLRSMKKDSSYFPEEKQQEEGKKSGYEGFWRMESDNEGNHNIGFRIVQGLMPTTESYSPHKSFVQQGIIQNTAVAKTGPDNNQPYFRKREIVPVPPNITGKENLDILKTTGLHPGILRHNHSPALVAASNGDIIALYFTSVSETSPNVALMGMRLRFGADEWDMPDLFLDFPDVNDAGPLLWNDNDTLRLFWASLKLKSGFPFQWINSTDNGATWSDVLFPLFKTPLGHYSAQPINAAFRDKKGNIYVASDAHGSSSVLWKSEDNGQTWIDPGGRTNGRHTSFVPLDDGRILGMGGKDSDIDGYMPQSLSDNEGRTWRFSATPFSPLGSNQRPTIIKLQNGHLFMAADLERKDGYQPKSIHQRGAFAAISRDDGKSWHIKRIPGTRPHMDSTRAADMKGGTLGYTVARQAPNGIIHLITSMTSPVASFAFNEAWILSGEEETDGEDELDKSKATVIENVKKYTEHYESGKLKSMWHAGTGNDGRYLLHGIEEWYYPNGLKQWTAVFDKGKKTGVEIYYDEEGNKIWSWKYNTDGTQTWTHWYKNGRKKNESTWKDKRATDLATEWDKDGNIMKQYRLYNGVMKAKMNQ